VGDTIYVGSDGVSQNHLFALDAATGAVRWKFMTPTQIFSTPAVADGVVYFHARNDHVYAVAARDGALLWKTPAPSPQDEFSVFADMVKSSTAVAKGRVLVGIDRELVALDAKTGAVLWRAATGRGVHSSPLVVGSTVYVGSDDRSVYGFDLESGRKSWSFATGGKVSVSPAVGEGMLLIGSNDGFLYAFGTAGR
jgi:outer membrane protein assembly factor BamB